MTGWYLVWILVIRFGSDFVIMPNERPVSGESCQKAKIELEIQIAANPVEWGDFTSFSVRCELR